jgi:hypothetical protein
MEDVAFRLAAPDILDEDAPEPEECAACGADVEEIPQGSSVPVCAPCLAEVDEGIRCAGCLDPIGGDGLPFGGRKYCKPCHERLVSEAAR